MKFQGRLKGVLSVSMMISDSFNEVTRLLQKRMFYWCFMDVSRIIQGCCGANGCNPHGIPPPQIIKMKRPYQILLLLRKDENNKIAFTIKRRH